MRFIERLQSGLAGRREGRSTKPALATARRVFVLLYKHAGAGKMAGRIAFKGRAAWSKAASRRGACEHGFK
jgi:hypothetical protein